MSPEAPTVGATERDQVVMMTFGALQLTIRILDGTTSYASNLLIEIDGAMRADEVALRPNSFVALEDVTRT